MDLQAQIDVLLTEANALRPLDDDDTRKIPLGAIVDKINALRAIEATQNRDAPTVAPIATVATVQVEKPKRGRPAKTEG